MSDTAKVFVDGALSCGFVVAAAFFLRFWLRTRERLFAAFAVGFCLMAANQAVAVFARTQRGEDFRAYLLRLAAFVLIIVAVLRKNSEKPNRGG